MKTRYSAHMVGRLLSIVVVALFFSVVAEAKPKESIQKVSTINSAKINELADYFLAFREEGSEAGPGVSYELDTFLTQQEYVVLAAYDLTYSEYLALQSVLRIRNYVTDKPIAQTEKHYNTLLANSHILHPYFVSKPERESFYEDLFEQVAQIKAVKKARLEDEVRRDAIVVPDCTVAVEVNVTATCELEKKAEGLSGFLSSSWKSLLGETKRQTLALSTPIADYSKNQRDLFELIASVPSGRKLLAQFLPRLKAGEFKIEAQPDPYLNKVTGGMFDFNTKTIYLSTFLKDLGSAAPVLVHEISHALDEKYAKEFRELDELESSFKKLPEDTSFQKMNLRDQLRQASSILRTVETKGMIYSFETERKAFDLEAQFRKELAAAIPCFDEYAKAQDEKAPAKLLGDFSDEAIIRMYGLDPALLEAYKKAKK